MKLEEMEIEIEDRAGENIVDDSFPLLLDSGLIGLLS